MAASPGEPVPEPVSGTAPGAGEATGAVATRFRRLGSPVNGTAKRVVGLVVLLLLPLLAFVADGVG